MKNDSVTLRRDENQARGIGRYLLEVLDGSAEPAQSVLDRLEQFHLDSVACAVSAIAQGTNAPSVLRNEAAQYPDASDSAGAKCFGSQQRVAAEKAVAANSSAVREWDANGTNFGYNPARSATAGEFGHNDFYPVAIAAAQVAGLDGRQALRGMLALDEIRGRLAEVFSLKTHSIDHVIHGAVASAAVYAAMNGANEQQIESAIGLVVAHYVPFRAIRAGHQLSDSKGASAALSAEMAVLSARRALSGFVGPGDVFRNPKAIFRLFEPTDVDGDSPFDLTLSTAGDDFAVMQMHFKLGLYEHQSAGAIQGLVDLLAREPALLDDEEKLRSVRIAIYEPAFSIIADPAKRDPQTRQSADHSMVYIIATLLRKAFESKTHGWKELMLMPDDYGEESLRHPLTRSLIQRIEVVHGGADYDAKYPDGIPTSLEFEHAELGQLSSGLIMYPAGHARNTEADLDALLDHKYQALARLGVVDVEELRARFTNLEQKTAEEIADLYAFDLLDSPSG